MYQFIFISRCDPSTCFLLHRTKGVLLHMNRKHGVTLQNRASLTHLTIPYELPIRINCEVSSVVYKAKERIRKWEEMESTHMFLEDEDEIVLGEEKTVYDDNLYKEDIDLVATRPLDYSTGTSKEQKEKLEATSDFDVYAHLQKLNQEVPADKDEFFAQGIKWPKLMPEFISCTTDEEMDEVRLDRLSKKEREDAAEAASTAQREAVVEGAKEFNARPIKKSSKKRNASVLE